MSLEEYEKKRKFRETPEPIAEIKPTSGGLRFVVQKHDASHLHYDLRLELDKVLKSWAVPKGPSLDPLNRHLAQMVEDHPLDYASFEGIIPPGNYGAGTVMVWDEGDYYWPGSKSRKETEDRMREGLLKGHISFVLEGKKLKGEFALVKFKKANDPNAWLLIKANDESATDQNVLQKDRSAVSGKTMDEIAQDKERLWQTTDGEIDLSSFPKSDMPRNIKPMLATLVKSPFNDPAWTFEIKWDGFRAISFKKGQEAVVKSRNNKVLDERFPEIPLSLRQLAGDFVVDGEIIVLNEAGKPSFSLTQNYQKNHQGVLVYYIFDLLYLNGHDLKKAPLSFRRETLTKVFPNSANIKVSDAFPEKGEDFFRVIKEQGLEGMVAKKLDSPYEEGRRSRNWLKIKTHLQQEFVIGGFTDPARGRYGFGSLLLGVYEKGNLLYIGNVGSGFSDQDLTNLRNVLSKLEVPNSLFLNIASYRDAHWVKPELVCEVKFQEWTGDNLLRQAVFLGLRDDKNPKEVARE